jgi:ribonuclease HI
MTLLRNRTDIIPRQCTPDRSICAAAVDPGIHADRRIVVAPRPAERTHNRCAWRRSSRGPQQQVDDNEGRYGADVTDLFADGTAVAPQSEGPLPQVVIYTDGACKRNPDGPGGWGIVLSSGRHHKELHGGSQSTTNNRMELTAVIEALNALMGPSEVELFTDSEYVRRGISEWIHNWKLRGWKTASKQPVKNVDLWRALDDAARRHNIDWRWVKGHDGNPGNERADALANLGAAEHT